MILGDRDHSGSNRTTLDDLFRRAGVRNADLLALADPPNKEALTGCPARRLTYAQADRAIAAMAATLRDLGLTTDTAVALQMPNTVESVIALLGVLRAGLIAVPMPLLWRQQDIVEALGRIGAKAIITFGRVGATEHAELAMQSAVDLFPIRYVGAFGSSLPDGVVPLDEIFAEAPGDFAVAAVRPGNPAAHVAAVTFDRGKEGHVAVARSHMEIVAGGLGIFLESGIATDTDILSTIPLSSFAGFITTLVPWLLSGGTLHLHHAFDAQTFTAQSASIAGTRVVPASVLTPLREAGLLDGAVNVVALWRSPERLAGSALWQRSARLTDVLSFGELGALALRRRTDGMPCALPLGAVANPMHSAGAVIAAETRRSPAGTLALRGPTIPAHAFPPGAERGYGPHLELEDDGFADTGFTCRVERSRNELIVTGSPGPLTAIGGYRFRTEEVDAAVAEVNADATIVALPDALLGERLAASGPDSTALEGELQARGQNPLVAGAFRARSRSDAA